MSVTGQPFLSFLLNFNKNDKKGCPERRPSTMQVTYRQEKSLNGFPLDVLKSALQKYIRRGDVEKAMYAAAELDLFALHTEGERIRTNFIHRMMVIFLEDVCLPEFWSEMTSRVNQLIDIRDQRKGLDQDSPEFRKIRQQEQQHIARIVDVLCHAPHSRENSFYKFCLHDFSHLAQNEKFVKLMGVGVHAAQEQLRKRFAFLPTIEASQRAEYPPKAVPAFVEKLTDLTLQTLIRQFIGSLEAREEVCIYFAHRLARYGNMPIAIQRKRKPVFMILHLIEFVIGKQHPYTPLLADAAAWFPLLPEKEDFLCWQSVLLLLLRHPLGSFSVPPPPKEEAALAFYQRNLDHTAFTFDEWVYDMHTASGRSRRKGSSYFAAEGITVVNEIKTVHQGYKEAYCAWKFLQEGGELPPSDARESDYGRFLVRAQLLCGNAKTDTYFVEKEAEIQFVKGPFSSRRETDAFLDVQKAKRSAGLPCVDYQVVMLVPDRFPDSPMGLRTRLSRDQPRPFLVSNVLFDHTPENLPVKQKSSKKWPETQVVDWDRVNGMTNVSKDALQSDDELMMAYVSSIIFRFLVGAGDFADRNFIVKHGKIYSIDEDDVGKDFDLEAHLRHHREMVFGFIQRHPVEIRDRIRHYKECCRSAFTDARSVELDIFLK